MTTPNDVFKFLIANYNYVEISDLFIRIEFREKIRNQWIYIGGLRDTVYMYSYFASTESNNAKDILEFASANSHFGTQVVGQNFALCHVVNVSHISPSDIAKEINLLGTSADALEKQLLAEDRF